jgi:UDP-N-acetylglucosamine 2-epimerase
MCQNVICTSADENEISAAIQKSLSPEFIKEARQTKSPYNGGETSKHIVNWLGKYLQSDNFGAPKEFYDAKKEELVTWNR